MKIRHSLLKNIGKTNPVFLALIILAVFASVYFLYSRQKGETGKYAHVIVGGGDVASAYWQANAVNIGDADVSSFGHENAIILDKETYEAGGHGIYVNLILRMNVVRDRSGVFLFKNKPVAIGEKIDLRFPANHLAATLLYFGDKKPDFPREKIRVVLNSRAIDPEKTLGIKTGDKLINNKNEILAEIVEAKIRPSEVRSDTAGGQAVVTFDQTKRDVEITVDLLVRKIGDYKIFQHNQKVKTGEQMDLIFNEVSLWRWNIISVSEN